MASLMDLSPPTAEDQLRLLEETPTEENSGQIVRGTLRLYGSIYLVIMIIFCYVRRRYPGAYNVRNVVPDLNCSLATDQFGWISWMWKVFFVSGEDIFQECGMDAIAFIRILNFGIKVSVVGMFNAIYLMPIYGTSPDSEETAYIVDRLQQVTLSNVPTSSPRTVATVVAAYIVFGYSMHLIMKEFEWFTEHRHRFLAQTRPDNYTVYVAGIPPEYRSSAALLEYFRECFSRDSVLEARVALDIPNLEKKVAEREALVTKLEHAMNVLDVKGVRPMHKTKMCGGEKVDSIEAYTKELEDMNKEISDAIEKIESMHDPLESGGKIEGTQRASMTSSLEGDGGAYECVPLGLPSPQETASADVFSDDEAANLVNDTSVHTNASSVDSKGHKKKISVDSFASTAKKVGGGAKSFATSAAEALLGGEDGNTRDAGFVSFADLKSTTSALQTIHHATPFTMQTQEAPLPEDVFWKNVGLTNKARQVGTLMGLGLTVALCLFWTVPVSFISSLTNVNSLKELLPFMEKWLEKAPWLEQVLAQLAPLLLLVLISLLPVILLAFAKLEGHIAESTLQASLFVKLALFSIIQTFFVSAISGTVSSELKNLLDNPTSIVDLLANSLPAQSAYFMQIVMVQTFLGMGLELLRVAPLAIAYIRSKFGPNLTEKERNTPWLGLRPLSNPDEFDHATVLSSMVLYFMVLFVYTAMAPMTSFILFITLVLLTMGYRHQLMYVYPPTNDSGGKLWTRFVSIAVWCMLIAQLTLIGVILLKKSPISSGLFIPLFIITILFQRYINQQHFYVTNHLPSRDCIRVDTENEEESGGRMDYEFVKGKYLQTALQTKVLEPETEETSTREAAQANGGDLEEAAPA